MRTRRPLILGTVVLVGLGVVPLVKADDDSDEPPAKHVSGHGIFNKLYDAIAPSPSKKPPAPEKKLEKKDVADAKKAAKPVGEPKMTIITADQAARAGADSAFYRRLAVCDQLREIGVSNEDHELERQADELSEKAWEVYSQHMSRVVAQKAEAEAADKTSAKSGKKSRSSGKTAADADKGPAPAIGGIP